MFKAIRLRLYPNKVQEDLFRKNCGHHINADTNAASSLEVNSTVGTTGI